MKMKMSTKLIRLFLVGGLLPFIAIGFTGYNIANTSLKGQAMNQLTSVREMKKAELENFFANRMSDIRILASSPITLEAMVAFKEAFKEIGAEKARRLYMFDNPFPESERIELIDAGDGSLYSTVHAKFHPFYKSYLKEYTYFYDIHFVDSETGDVVYAVWKEDDFGTNFYTGKYRDTNIGELVRLVNSSQNNTVKRSDFQFYEPAYGMSQSHF